MGRSNYCRNHMTKFFVASFLLMLAIENVRPEDFNYESDPGMLSSNCQLDNVLQSLLSPDELSSIHVQALRQELLRILNNDALRETHDIESNYDDKRSIASLARSSQFPFEYKRNLGSLARSGYVRPGPYKRSIATLAKNGQLPTLQSPEEEEAEEIDSEEHKRGIESLARSGAINRFLKKSLESLARSGYAYGKRYGDNNYDNKRNIGALARNGYLKRDIDNFMDNLYQKRYVGSLARQYNLPSGKRNMGALARNGGFSRYVRNDADELYEEDKRNLQSLVKSGSMIGGKRNLASLIRNQNVPYLARGSDFKRNIGAIARDWALPNQSTSYERTDEDKRNVAALLRQDSYLHSMNRNHAIDAHPTEMDEGIPYEEKRNIASLKAQATSGYNSYGNRNIKRSIGDAVPKEKSRTKRQADDYFSSSDEYSVPVMQNTNSLDYEELLNALHDNYPSYDKRFLGNIPLSRMAELGKLSLMGHQSTSNTTPTSPTYRRRQYLLSRTHSEDNEQ